MPFPDELTTVNVVPYDESWPSEFRALASRLRPALDDLPVSIDHVGSTSVPGLAAKDVIDIQVRVMRLDPDLLTERLTRIGFRRRGEAWNNEEVSFGVSCPKLTFAPAPGERPANISVRIDGEPNSRAGLLFRDFLRSDESARDAWGTFKVRLAAVAQDLAIYGQVKAPATEILLAAADRWARADGSRESETTPRASA